MKIVAIIPSRYGSNRFEGKPLAKIKGQCMIQRVFQRTASAACVQHVVVATDDQRIYDAVCQFGGNAMLTSTTLRSGTDRVAEAAKRMGLDAKDIVINVQGDQPLIDPGCLDEIVEPLKNDASLGMSTLAYAIVDKQEYANPKDCKVVMDESGNALYFSRAPIPFARDDVQWSAGYKHLGIYAYTSEFLKVFSQLPTGRLEEIEKLEQLRALEHGHRIRVVVTEVDSPEVDLPEDIIRIEAMLGSNR
jgi:3-deoxy-manno-octulosonate cytidylyltransferase (CMP-KDO synthetase)